MKTICQYVNSGCNVPESECMGACMQGHTGAQIVQFPKNRNPIEIDGPYRRESLGHRVAFRLCIAILVGFFIVAWLGWLK